MAVMPVFKRSVVQLVAVLIFQSGALPHASFAEEPGPVPKPLDHPDDSKPQHDPTAASDKLKQAMRGPEKAAPAPKPQAALPAMALKGIVQAKGKAAAAMIDVKGPGIVSVKEGSQFTVQLSDGQSVVMTVKQISSDAVELEAADRKNPILVR